MGEEYDLPDDQSDGSFRETHCSGDNETLGDVFEGNTEQELLERTTPLEFQDCKTARSRVIGYPIRFGANATQLDKFEVSFFLGVEPARPNCLYTLVNAETEVTISPFKLLQLQRKYGEEAMLSVETHMDPLVTSAMTILDQSENGWNLSIKELKNHAETIKVQAEKLQDELDDFEHLFGNFDEFIESANEFHDFVNNELYGRIKEWDPAEKYRDRALSEIAAAAGEDETSIRRITSDIDGVLNSGLKRLVRSTLKDLERLYGLRCELDPTDRLPEAKCMSLCRDLPRNWKSGIESVAAAIASVLEPAAEAIGNAWDVIDSYIPDWVWTLLKYVAALALVIAIAYALVVSAPAWLTSAAATFATATAEFGTGVVATKSTVSVVGAILFVLAGIEDTGRSVLETLFSYSVH